jgi:hypothetical protein
LRIDQALNSAVINTQEVPTKSVFCKLLAAILLENNNLFFAGNFEYDDRFINFYFFLGAELVKSKALKDILKKAHNNYYEMQQLENNDSEGERLVALQMQLRELRDALLREAGAPLKQYLSRD